jgi:hypothetical protein
MREGRSGLQTVSEEPRLAQLIGELSLSDADFRTWWAERHASYAVSGSKALTHPLTGPYTLDWQVLRLPEDDQILMVMTAPDAASLEALHRIASSDGASGPTATTGAPKKDRPDMRWRDPRRR